MTKSLNRLLILLIFIFVSASAYLLSTKNNTVLQTSNPTSTPKINIQQEDIKPAILKNRKTSTEANKKIESTPPTTTTSIKPETSSSTINDPAETISAKFIIENKEYPVNVNPETTAYEGMLKLKALNQISFSAKKFSGLGYLIEEINGIKNSPSTGFYWTLYINNEEAKVGASNYTLKTNDIITWKYVRK